MNRAATEAEALPDGWRWVKLGDVCEINPRRAALKRDDSAPTSFIPMECIDATSGAVSELRVRPYGEIKKGYTFFVEGDVLFSKITPCMQNGKHTIPYNLSDRIGFGTTEFHVIRSSKDIVPEIVWFYLRQPDLLVEATEHFTGSVGQQRLPADYLANLDIPLPPLAEQKRIATTLKEQMAAVENARVAAQTRLEAIKALPAAFLRQIFPQPDQPLPDGWRRVKLGEVLEIADSGIWGNHDPEHGTSVLRSTNFRSNGKLDFSNLSLRDIPEEKRNKKLLSYGDILLERSGGGPKQPVGRVCLFHGDTQNHSFGNFCQRLRCKKEECDSEFLFQYLYLFHLSGQTQFYQKQTTGIRNLEYKRYIQIEIPLPHLSEQKRIAAILKEQMVTVEKSSTAAEEGLNTINAIPAALLRRAFNGEL